MRRGTLALTLALGLTLGGVLSAAEEPGNWFTRWFTKQSDKAPSKSSAKSITPTLTPNLPNVAMIRAQSDLQRRQSVCLKLREIAITNNDDELLARSEQLDQRAFELYKAARERALAQPPIGDEELKKTEKGKKGGGR